VYINVPKHPWLFPAYATESDHVMPFISTALNPTKPSNNKLRNVNAPVRLEIPNFTVKLSDNISGVILNQGFVVNLHNNDGYFDHDDTWDLFNTPVRLKKAVVEDPEYADFLEIRSGAAEDTRTTLDMFSIIVADKLRSLEGPVCNVVRQEDYFLIALLPDVLGRNIPVVYGEKKINVLKITETPERYIACENITALQTLFARDDGELPAFLNNGIITLNYNAVTGVYDSDDASLLFDRFTDHLQLRQVNNRYPSVSYITDSENNRIPFRYESQTGILKYAEATAALVTGYTSNNVGEIIQDLVTRKTVIQYNNSNWNRGEVESYINMAADVNISFTGGDIKKAIQDVLRNDMAYFIQQMDGRFTIRKYGEQYGYHEIESWTMTQKPDKDYAKAQAHYFSSCVINYDFQTDDNYKVLLFNEMENDAEDRYRKRLLRTFDTDLFRKTDAQELAELMGTRYTVMRQNIKVGLGIDTTQIELLDTVSILMDVNQRSFSVDQYFTVVEINPAQDILTLEAVDFLDISGEYPETDDLDYEFDYDNMFADTLASEFEMEIDGGTI